MNYSRGGRQTDFLSHVFLEHFIPICVFLFLYLDDSSLGVFDDEIIMNKASNQKGHLCY